MEHLTKVKTMVLTEETIMAVRKSVEALDAILERVFQSARGADQALFKEWAIITGKMTALFKRDLVQKHYDLLQIMKMTYVGPPDRDEAVKALNDIVSDLETKQADEGSEDDE